MKVITRNLLNRFWENGIKPLKEELKNKLDTNKIVASTNISEAGKVMDGKTASEEFAKLKSNLNYVSELLPSLPFTGVKEVKDCLMETIETGLYSWYGAVNQPSLAGIIITIKYNADRSMRLALTVDNKLFMATYVGGTTYGIWVEK